METDAERVSFADNLCKVIDHMTTTDTAQLKFLCAHYIPSGSLENMDITELIQSLRERGIISAEKFDFLAECLILIGRLDIVNQLGFDKTDIEVFASHLKKYESTAGLSNFKILLFYLAEDLSKDEVKKLILYLGEKAHIPKGKMKMCCNGFDMMSLLIKVDYVRPNYLHNLLDLANVLNRMDLIRKIETYEAAHGSNNEAYRKPVSLGCQEESKTSKDENDEFDKESDAGGWHQLVKCIPPEKHYSLCENLGIPGKKYKLFKKSPDKLLKKSYDQKVFTLSDLENVFKELNLKIPSSCREKLDDSSKSDKKLESYVMTAQPRGICLIFNNTNFKPKSLKDRIGSDVDRDALVKLFKSFHFVVNVAEDQTQTEMDAKLKEVASRDHTKYDCFVCCILSHGKENLVYGVNGDVLPYKKFTLPFQPSKCKSLAGKPKLFFIQACQGGAYQSGEADQSGEEVWETDGSPALIPNEADFLMAYATVHGYVSFRSRTKGSWFVQNLCTIFAENAERFDLSDMLLMVNNSVSKVDGVLKEGEATWKQVPAPSSTLRKKIYFLDNSKTV